MNLTPDEARQSLETVEAAAISVKAFGSSGGPYFLVIWGIVALLGFLGSQFLSSPALRDGLWIGLVIVGNIASGIVGARLGARMRNESGPRLAALSTALFAYTLVWLWIAQPLDWQQTALLATLALMFLYVAIGLWLSVPNLIAIGAAESVVALAGYVFLRGWFGLWMAVTLGGGLIAMGILMWRRRT